MAGQCETQSVNHIFVNTLPDVIFAANAQGSSVTQKMLIPYSSQVTELLEAYVHSRRDTLFQIIITYMPSTLPS